MSHTIAVPTETRASDGRVALTPPEVTDLVGAGWRVCVQRGAGVRAGFVDAAYEEAGAELVADRAAAFAEGDVVVQVRALGASDDGGAADLAAMRSGQVVVAMCSPLDALEPIEKAAAAGVRVLALELVPRITRAQSMDVLSSMATVSGYKAVLDAAVALPSMFPMLMTAAGTLRPSRVFVIGAGVAGLHAMATAKRLGASVEGYDIRPAAAEQVRSVGARFVELPLEAEDAEDAGGYAKAQDERFYARQRELLTDVVGHSDVVITTANIPGRKAPVLVTEEMVEAMPPGGVIVDLAAERGGNCACTKAGETVEVSGVRIMGPTDLAASVPRDASRLFGRNVATLIKHAFSSPESLELDREDAVIAGTLATADGAVVHPRLLPAEPAPLGDT